MTTVEARVSTQAKQSHVRVANLPKLEREAKEHSVAPAASKAETSEGLHAPASRSTIAS